VHATLALTDERGRGAAAGRIGPNAVIRVAEVLTEEMGAAATRTLFTAAGLSRYLDAMPDEMIDEDEVTLLHAVLRERLGVARARHVGWQAGHRTGDYLLAHRIPRGAQRLLRAMPAALAEALLLAAVGRHAWTFAGSGRFAARPGAPTVVQIDDNPLCRGVAADEPACAYHAATFERLWRALVDSRTTVVETACCAQGAPACRFELRRPRGAKRGRLAGD
jgi:divinyl protochlorophyllide a 8-vinyl-reductase